jgi:hypothetical protein
VTDETIPSETIPSETIGESRRSFLTKLGLGTAALALVSVPFFPWGRNKTSQASATSGDFPGEDSIFHPRSDPRL